jgi:hypothetical protein
MSRKGPLLAGLSENDCIPITSIRFGQNHNRERISRYQGTKEGEQGCSEAAAGNRHFSHYSRAMSTFLARRVYGLRMLAAKNSRNRSPTRSRRFWVSVGRLYLADRRWVTHAALSRIRFSSVSGSSRCRADLPAVRQMAPPGRRSMRARPADVADSAEIVCGLLSVVE